MIAMNQTDLATTVRDPCQRSLSFDHDLQMHARTHRHCEQKGRLTQKHSDVLVVPSNLQRA